MMSSASPPPKMATGRHPMASRSGRGDVDRHVADREGARVRLLPADFTAPSFRCRPRARERAPEEQAAGSVTTALPGPRGAAFARAAPSASQARGREAGPRRPTPSRRGWFARARPASHAAPLVPAVDPVEHPEERVGLALELEGAGPRRSLPRRSRRNSSSRDGEVALLALTDGRATCSAGSARGLLHEHAHHVGCSTK